MFQQGQVLRVRRRGKDGSPHWAYRYRVGGRGSKRVQRGGFKSEQAAIEALERALERLQRERGLVEAPPLRELVDVDLAQHNGEPETVEKLRWLLGKAVGTFGHRRISQLRPAEIAAWRITIPAGHRFEATQALRQVLARAVSWGLIDVNPANQGVDNPQRRRIYDLRHTFATFALRAGISTFELSRYMGTSLGMIDRHYGHLARDGREHAIRLLDLFTGAEPDVHAVDAAWTLTTPTVAEPENTTPALSRQKREAL